MGIDLWLALFIFGFGSLIGVLVPGPDWRALLPQKAPEPEPEPEPAPPKVTGTSSVAYSDENKSGYHLLFVRYSDGTSKVYRTEYGIVFHEDLTGHRVRGDSRNYLVERFRYHKLEQDWENRSE